MIVAEMPFPLLLVHKTSVTFTTFVGQLLAMHTFYMFFKILVCVCRKFITMRACDFGHFVSLQMKI